MSRKPKWFRTKGYLHLTPSFSVTDDNWRKYYARISDPSFIARYAFFPLIHRVIKTRRYKKVNSEHYQLKKGKTRGHSHRRLADGVIERHRKERPLHYASHFDSLIYAYYAHRLGKSYEISLKADPELDAAVIAYRSVPISDSDKKGKSNIHFAKEVFDEIGRRVNLHGDTAVLALDLKNFFSSLDHQLLYKRWANIIEQERLPKDHFNLYKSCTNFSYILYDDLKKNRRSFDESKLAEIRRKYGFRCFFESHEAFRSAIKSGRLRVYKNPFHSKEHVNGKKKRRGIPQGLPLSAVLANIYLYEFDKEVVEKLVKDQGMYYRRYSDDIIVLCPIEKLQEVDEYINQLITRFKLEISKDKTEQFFFKKLPYNKTGDIRIQCVQLYKDKCIIDSPLTYLGFEYRGHNTVIKSTNLSKYYRRLITVIKSRGRRAIKLSEMDPTVPRAIYMNQIKKLYNAPLRHGAVENTKQVFRRRFKLVENDRGEFDIAHEEFEVKRPSNYITYIRRCDQIFNTRIFSTQLRKKRQIISEAINRHLLKR